MEHTAAADDRITFTDVMYVSPDNSRSMETFRRGFFWRTGREPSNSRRIRCREAVQTSTEARQCKCRYLPSYKLELGRNGSCYAHQSLRTTTRPRVSSVSMHGQSITVVDHGISWAPLRVAAAPRCARRPTARALAAFGALLVHALAFAVLLTVQPRALLERDRLAGVVTARNGHAIQPFTLVELDEAADAEAQWPEPPALAALHLRALMHLSLRNFELPRTDHGEVEALEESARSTNPVAIEGDDRAQLMARYIGQIKARIERSWESLDALPGAIVCEAHITQATDGVVLAVRLANCAADEARRAALLTAVRRSSPLPAPPASQIFAERVVIAFGR
jgi:hypothetical protein